MNLHRRIATAATAATALASLAACGDAAPPGAAPPASRPGAPASPAAGASPSAAQPSAAPPEVVVPSPTVARVQDWVEIFSGPADRDLPAPSDRYAGSRTIELNATAEERIGTYVSDGAGMTLYRFDKDRTRSACNGRCAETWPPLLVRNPGKIYPSGVDPERVGYIERADGTCQVTVDGRPLYYYSRDEKPGDLKGQGVQGTWFAVSPSGGRTRSLPDVVEAPAGEQ